MNSRDYQEITNAWREQMESRPSACEHCIYSVLALTDAPDALAMRCTHPEVKDEPARAMRSYTGRCGPEAALWVQNTTRRRNDPRP